MKAQLTAKYLQFLSKKNKNQNAGFTLIELLVVIIIIGILSAIALPSFLNQASKARQSEARTNVGAMNRAQQSYYLENQAFVAGDDAITKLAIGIKDSDNFNYTAVSETPADDVINNGIAKNDDLKSYAGGVFKETASGTTTSFLCEENAPVEGEEAVTTPPDSTGCTGETTALK